ncbi:hypothetical protein HMPREF1979_02654 [Actinomyces johnsonii F0542]|uniref:Uncharacterized protein n=1 Tax=Actinomyces johnsonii F0542 TaxID=1321818 RepID=U1RV89_9ACTO|nr:hypothetical protein HMPREF1979_02654 [Actinomyces johnsonii F0542]
MWMKYVDLSLLSVVLTDAARSQWRIFTGASAQEIALWPRILQIRGHKTWR